MKAKNWFMFLTSILCAFVLMALGLMLNEVKAVSSYEAVDSGLESAYQTPNNYKLSSDYGNIVMK